MVRACEDTIGGLHEKRGSARACERQGNILAVSRASKLDNRIDVLRYRLEVGPDDIARSDSASYRQHRNRHDCHKAESSRSH